MKEHLFNRKTLAATLGTAAVGLAMGSSPLFAATDLGQGYQVSPSAFQQVAEGSCGGAAAAEKAAEGSCGEGKCGGAAAAEKAAEGSCGEGGAAAGEKTTDKSTEGKCGEGRCGS